MSLNSIAYQKLKVQKIIGKIFEHPLFRGRRVAREIGGKLILENFIGVVNVPRFALPLFFVGKYLFHRIPRWGRGRGSTMNFKGQKKCQQNVGKIFEGFFVGHCLGRHQPASKPHSYTPPTITVAMIA